MNEISLEDRIKTILEKKEKGKIEPLTPDKLRKRPGAENLSDEDANDIINTIKKLASIFFEISQNNEK